MAYRSHRLDVYGADLYLATTKHEWQTLGRRISTLEREVPEAAGSSIFATFHPNDGSRSVPVLILWLDLAAHASSSDLVNTIAHEASHAAGQLLDYLGHDIRGTDEPHAYLVGWLAAWMWDNAGEKRAAELT